MRSIDEIQRAHDMLGPLLRDELERFKLIESDKAAFIIICRTLCWVLQDQNSSVTENAFATLESRLKEAGYQLPDEPDIPFPMKKKPGQG